MSFLFGITGHLQPIGGKCYAAIACGATSGEAGTKLPRNVTRFVFLALLAGGQKGISQQPRFSRPFAPCFAHVSAVAHVYLLDRRRQSLRSVPSFIGKNQIRYTQNLRLDAVYSSESLTQG